MVFDLGGVLVELDGAPPAMPGSTLEESWARWLASPMVRAFESGAIDADAFADRMVSSLAPGMSPERFLDRFMGWPIGPYDGAVDLVEGLPDHIITATLSNSNDLHWPLFMAMGLDEPFEHHFPSHRTGLVKPDAAAFRNVIDGLGFAPAEILFLDDQVANVDAARTCGAQARQVSAVEGARAALIECGVYG